MLVFMPLWSVGRMQVVFLNRFTAEVLNFSNLLQREIEDISGDISPGTTSTSIQAEPDDSALVKKKVSLCLVAPEIFVPVDSFSSEALVLDCGRLEVHDDTNFEGDDWFEGFDIVLHNTSVARAELKGLRVVASTRLVQPLKIGCTVTMCVKSAQPLLCRPVGTSVDLNVPVLDSTICPDDYAMVMRVLERNFTESATIIQPRAVEEMAELRPSVREEPSSSSLTQVAPKEMVLPPALLVPLVRDSGGGLGLHVSTTIEGLRLNMVFERETPDTSARPCAELLIHEFSAEYTQHDYSDTGTEMTASLTSIQRLDHRQGERQTKFPKVISPTQMSTSVTSGQQKSFLQVNVSQQRSLVRVVGVRDSVDATDLAATFADFGSVDHIYFPKESVAMALVSFSEVQQATDCIFHYLEHECDLFQVRFYMIPSRIPCWCFFCLCVFCHCSVCFLCSYWLVTGTEYLNGGHHFDPSFFNACVALGH